MNAKHNRQIGQWGETQAADYLISGGWDVIGRNIRTPYGEIDIVAQRSDVTLFIEVKTRTSGSFGFPEVSVNMRKLRHMLSAAAHYAAEHHIDHWQLDVISVEGKPGTTPTITHFENVS